MDIQQKRKTNVQVTCFFQCTVVQSIPILVVFDLFLLTHIGHVAVARVITHPCSVSGASLSCSRSTCVYCPSSGIACPPFNLPTFCRMRRFTDHRRIGPRFSRSISRRFSRSISLPDFLFLRSWNRLTARFSARRIPRHDIGKSQLCQLDIDGVFNRHDCWLRWTQQPLKDKPEEVVYWASKLAEPGVGSL